MDEIGNSGFARGLGDGAGAFGLHGVEGLLAPGRENADEIDRGFGAAQRGGERIGIADIGLNGVDLADAAERLQMEGEVGTPRRDADAPAVARQRANQMAAEEAGAAEDGDDAILGLNVGHSI